MIDIDMQESFHVFFWSLVYGSFQSRLDGS